MSLLSFFGSLVDGIYNGIGWFYNNTIGAFTSYLGGVLLSSAESFVLHIVGAGLSAFAFIINAVVSFFNWIMGLETGLALSVGIFGFPLAIFVTIGILILAVSLIKIVVDLL